MTEDPFFDLHRKAVSEENQVQFDKSKLSPAARKAFEKLEAIRAQTSIHHPTVPRPKGTTSEK
ncbi:hypothetical protein A2630_02010 [Candidatus Woesebacteria bacterium RIFCSPHIGHO2_01_FULL_44_10]|nr:MAG: hypothetical protein A2630_02010 [Candidatus Woesebacteria bacterium RIFCSPHIGHO2_01_FULL_44_10]OGM55789.1 MAG: hypothetical protein A3F62_04155 [Candidatus Woesebacteria bacterium RIFCSPHIGHO2_12_FULL_44_11]